MLQSNLLSTTSKRLCCFLLVLSLNTGSSLLTFAATPLPVGIPVDIIFSIDSSGSMGPPPPEVPQEERSQWNRDPQNRRIQACKLFMDKLHPSLHWVGVVSWDARERGFPGIDFAFGPTDDYAIVRNLLSRIDSRGGGTDLGLGLGEALNLLKKSPRKHAKKVVLFLTDGIGKFDRRLLQEAKDLQATVYTIGLSVPPEAKKILEEIAAATGGHYFPAPEAEALEEIFEAIRKKSISLPVLAHAGDTMLELTWSPPEGLQVAGYRVYRAGSTRPIHGERLLAQPHFRDMGLSNGRAYTYVVIAVLADGTEWKGYQQVASTPGGK